MTAPGPLCAKKSLTTEPSDRITHLTRDLADLLRMTVPTCAFERCGRPRYAKGLCQAHRRQQLRGHELTPLRYKPSLPQRLPPRAYRPDSRGYMRRPNGGGTWVYEHREVMERVLGRPLLPGENVHHINGQKADNRPENLELWVTFQPSGQRPDDLVAWALEVLDRYSS